MQFRIHILKLQFALTNYITVPNNLPYVVFFFFPSAHITPQHVIQKLAQMCLVVSSSNGRVFRPKVKKFVKPAMFCHLAVLI